MIRLPCSWYFPFGKLKLTNLDRFINLLCITIGSYRCCKEFYSSYTQQHNNRIQTFIRSSSFVRFHSYYFLPVRYAVVLVYTFHTMQCCIRHGLIPSSCIQCAQFFEQVLIFKGWKSHKWMKRMKICHINVFQFDFILYFCFLCFVLLSFTYMMCVLVCPTSVSFQPLVKRDLFPTNNDMKQKSKWKK